MNSIFAPVFKALQKPAKLITIITFYIITAFALLTNLPDTDDGFFGVVGELITLTIMLVLWAIVPTLLLLKKEEAAAKVFPFVLFYWLIDEIITFLSHGLWIRSGIQGLYITVGVFDFLIALILLAAVVLIVLGMLKKTLDFGFLPYVIAACTYLFYLVAFILWLVIRAKANAEWSDYFDVIVSYMIQPIGIFFAVLYFFIPKQGKTE